MKMFVLGFNVFILLRMSFNCETKFKRIIFDVEWEYFEYFS